LKSDGESEDCDTPAESSEVDSEDSEEEAVEEAEADAVRAFFVELLGKEDGQRAGGAIKLRPKRGARVRLDAVRQSWEVLVELMGTQTATAYVRRSPKMLVGRPQTLRQAWAVAVQVNTRALSSKIHGVSPWAIRDLATFLVRSSSHMHPTCLV